MVVICYPVHLELLISKDFKNGYKMKNLFLALYIALSFYHVNSQPMWSHPQLLTNSLYDNTNGHIVCIDYEGLSIQDSVFLFWEQSINDSSTAICFREISSMSEPKTILAQDGVHFKNPQAMKYTLEADTIFFLFYETNQNGTSDIYYLKYLEDDTYGGPNPYLLSEDDAENLNISHRSIVWEQSGQIFFSAYKFWDSKYQFTQPQLISYGNCSKPDIYADEIIAWLQDSTIYFSRWNRSEKKWSNPDKLYGTGENRNLTISKQNFGDPVLAWQNRIDTTWNIFTYNVSEEEIYLLDHNPSFNKKQPSVFVYPQVTKKAAYIPFATICTFVDDSINENTEIYANSEFRFKPDFENISNSPATERNPFLFEGRSYMFGKIELYNVWESFIGNHWQLYLSKLLMDNSAIDDLSVLPFEFSLEQNFPNPFNNSTTISYRIPEVSNVSLKIFNLLGQEVATLVSKKQPAGHYKVNWNADGIAGGLYFCRIAASNSAKSWTKTRKLILIK